MQISKIKFGVFFIGITLIQLVINITTKISVDALGIMLIVLLAYGFYSLRFTIMVSLLADLIGHWFLGSHLFAIIVIGFLIQRLVNYFRLSNFIQKTLILCVFYSILVLIITLINGVLHNYAFEWSSYFIEMVLLCPIILMLFNLYLIKFSSSHLL